MRQDVQLECFQGPHERKQGPVSGCVSYKAVTRLDSHSIPSHKQGAEFSPPQVSEPHGSVLGQSILSPALMLPLRRMRTRAASTPEWLSAGLQFGKSLQRISCRE